MVSRAFAAMGAQKWFTPSHPTAIRWSVSAPAIRLTSTHTSSSTIHLGMCWTRITGWVVLIGRVSEMMTTLGLTLQNVWENISAGQTVFVLVEGADTLDVGNFDLQVECDQ